MNAKRKKLIYLIITLIVVLLVVIIIPNFSFADKYGLADDLNTYRGNMGNSPIFDKFANVIIGVIQVVGTLTSVIVLVVIGIRYMVSSIEQKAEYKKTMGNYIIGCVMLFAISNILGIAYDILSKW